MTEVLHIKPSAAGIHWVTFVEVFCAKCGEQMVYKNHGAVRTINIDGTPVRVIQCYYKCWNPACGNENTRVARHPELVPFKTYSRSTFARVAFLRYVRGFSVKQIMAELGHVKKDTCYNIINDFRAAARPRASERVAGKLPPGSKVRVSIDGMEVEKGEPGLYTVREVGEGELVAAEFLEDASKEALHALLDGVLRAYGWELAGIVSDKAPNIVAMRDAYYPRVPHQYCVVHFLKNVTAALGEADRALKKDLRREVRQLSVLKTIKRKERAGAPALAGRELSVLADTRTAIRETVNVKKKDLFDLPGRRVYENLSEAKGAVECLAASAAFARASAKFQVLVWHLLAKIREIVARFYPRYQQVALGDYYLHPAFDAVARPHPKHPRRAFDKLVRRWRAVAADEAVPAFVRGLVQEAVRLAKSYARGLFVHGRHRLPR
ncbi:MAG: hypothetical protein ACTSU5_00500, partial [Promethearchaeota archaeon]